MHLLRLAAPWLGGLAALTAGLGAARSAPRFEAAAPARPAPQAARKKEKPKKMRVYIGTYTGSGSKGIYLLELDMATGKLTDTGHTTMTANPSFLTLSPDYRHLYAVNEIGDFQGTSAGSVTAFAVDASGALKKINVQSSGGGAPCHISRDKAGKHVFLANYSGGSIACLPVRSDGGLGEPTAFIQHEGTGPNKERQEGPHAHSINLDAANHFAFAADLGLDRVFVYRFDASSGTLTPNDPPAAKVAPGAGPRHFAFHPSGKFAYVINEMACTVTAFRYDAAKGTLSEIQTVSTTPDGVKPGYSTAEVQVSPDGKHLYGSNRGHHSIAVFAIDGTSGKLTPVEREPTQGKTPRNFGIDPTGTYVIAANQDSDTLVVFRRDAANGKLTPTGHTLSIPKPVCVKFAPAP